MIVTKATTFSGCSGVLEKAFPCIIEPVAQNLCFQNILFWLDFKIDLESNNPSDQSHKKILITYGDS